MEKHFHCQVNWERQLRAEVCRIVGYLAVAVHGRGLGGRCQVFGDVSTPFERKRAPKPKSLHLPRSHNDCRWRTGSTRVLEGSEGFRNWSPTQPCPPFNCSHLRGNPCRVFTRKAKDKEPLPFESLETNVKTNQRESQKENLTH